MCMGYFMQNRRQNINCIILHDNRIKAQHNNRIKVQHDNRITAQRDNRISTH